MPLWIPSELPQLFQTCLFSGPSLSSRAVFLASCRRGFGVAPQSETRLCPLPTSPVSHRQSSSESPVSSPGLPSWCAGPFSSCVPRRFGHWATKAHCLSNCPHPRLKATPANCCLVLTCGPDRVAPSPARPRGPALSSGLESLDENVCKSSFVQPDLASLGSVLLNC